MSFHAPFRLFFLFVVLLSALPAHAAAVINEEGAQKLKSLFETALANMRDTNRPENGQLIYEGEVLVEQASTYYAVTLPHTRVAYPDGSRLDIGMVSVNAAPHDVPGQWKMAVAIPTPMIMTDKAQTQTVRINIGAQKASGIWDEELENFAKLDAQYKNLTIENTATGYTAQIPEAQILYDFSKSADGFWSGPGRVLARNISINNGQQSQSKLAEIRGDFALDRYNPATLKEYRSFLKTFLSDLEKSKQTGTTVAQAKTDELGRRLTELLLNSSDGFKGTYAMKGLEVSRLNPVRKTPETLRISDIELGLDASGLRNPKATLNLQLAYDGFSITPPAPGTEDIMPESTNIDMQIKDVPARQLSEMLVSTIQTSTRQPGMLGNQVSLQLVNILPQAGSVITVRDNHIAGKNYRFDLNGHAKADMNAIFRVTSDFKGTFKGLDGLLAKVRAIATDINHPSAKNAQGLARSLEMLKNWGKAQPGPDGQNIYTYDFQLTPQGQMVINGAPAGFGLLPAISGAP